MAGARLFATAVLFLAVLVSGPGAVQANIVNCGFCVCERASITCDFDAVKTRIKENVQLADFVPNAAALRTQGLDPLTFEDLYINCKNSRVLLNQRLTKDLLEAYSKMKKVAIVRCDLTAIDADAFQRLYHLEEFDASDNNLTNLPPRLFGQRKMTYVKLSENRQLRLDALVFFGLTLQRLILTRCELKEFPLSAIFPVEGLRELTLSENRIRFVPSDALSLIKKLTVFYLDDNPISCTCANKWLRESVNWDSLSPSVMRKSKLPTCKSPFNLMDIELTKVDPARFRCSPPRITDVALQLSHESAQLHCSAVIDPPADEAQQQQSTDLLQQSLTWSYQHLPGVSDAAYTFPVLPGPEPGARFLKTFRRTPGFAAEKFVVYVRNSEGQAAALNVSVEWPPPPAEPALPPPPSAPSPTSAKRPPSQVQQPPPPPRVAVSPTLTLQPPVLPENAGQPDPTQTQAQPADYYAAKQFTLVEMIVAVIGTFMATSLLFLLSCQFTRWYRRRDRKRWLPGYAQHTYSAAGVGATTYAYNPAQIVHHQASSLSQHEYDVPRIDQPCLPKPPPPPSSASVAGSSEFLDFTNPRLKYNV